MSERKYPWLETLHDIHDRVRFSAKRAIKAPHAWRHELEIVQVDDKDILVWVEYEQDRLYTVYTYDDDTIHFIEARDPNEAARKAYRRK